MSFDLYPRNKKIKEIRMGWFTWSMFLQETGMGYVLGYGKSRAPGGYVYQLGNHGSPVSNDGYIVRADEARAMAMVVRGFVSVQRYVNEEWEQIPEEDRDRQKNLTNGISRVYRDTWAEERLQQLEKFADFAEKSSGFKIN